MNMLKILLSAFALLVLSSCQKLNTTPEDSLSPANYYETEAQLNTALTGVYDLLGRTGLYGDYMIARLALDGDEGFYRISSAKTGVAVFDAQPTDIYITANWKALYEGINRANLLLENINKPVMDETKRGQIKGQALFLRAYYYFLLVSNYGKVPLLLSSPKSADASEVNVPQSSVKVVYDQVYNDMKTAEGLVASMESLGGYAGRISKPAVQGILARVCLYMAGAPLNEGAAKYTEAKYWANEVIKTGYHSLNPSFQQVFINYAQDKYDTQYRESIWEVEFYNDATTNEIGRVGSNNGILQTLDAAYSYGYTQTTRRLYSLYATGDLRRDWTIAAYKFTASPYVKTNWTATQIYERNGAKYRREYETATPVNKNGGGQNFALLRYSDVLLMYAEAENQLNGPTGAYEYINMVRRRGYGLASGTQSTTVDLKGLTQLQFLAELKKERSRELAFESLRKRDLVRWGDFSTTMAEVAAEFVANASTGTKFGALGFTNAKERDVLWPIPYAETSLNKSIVQNEGW